MISMLWSAPLYAARGRFGFGLGGTFCARHAEEYNIDKKDIAVM